jgi:RND family efflux transporter MFP subunit
MMIQSKLTFGLIAFVLVIYTGCQSKTAYQAPPPPKVTVVNPMVKTVPLFLEENGQTEAVGQAVVRARVPGILKEIKFQPDSEVSEGTLLFQIEKDEYLAAVESARASVSSAKAALGSAQAAIGVANAKIDSADAAKKVSQAEFDRKKILFDDKAISQSEYDSAVAERDSALAAEKGAQADKVAKETEINNAEAQIEKAQADLKNKQLDLDRTTIMAPISGRLTKTSVKLGNLVKSGEPLVEIVRRDPIWANFNVSERFLLDFQRANATKDDERINPKDVKVELQRSGDIGFPFKGTLDYVAPKIDQDTGTLQMRAVFDNPEAKALTLVPGLFVRVRVQIGVYENALLIPERATARDQVGTFVFVVGDDKKAIRKNVKVGTKQDDMVVITSGLSPDDSVIVAGLQRVRLGVEVDPQ